MKLREWFDQFEDDQVFCVDCYDVTKKQLLSEGKILTTKEVTKSDSRFNLYDDIESKQLNKYFGFRVIKNVPSSMQGYFYYKMLDSDIFAWAPENPEHAKAPMDHINIKQTHGYPCSVIHVKRDPNKSAMEYCGAVCFSLTANGVPKNLTLSNQNGKKEIVADYSSHKIIGNANDNGKLISNKVIVDAKKSLNYRRNQIAKHT